MATVNVLTNKILLLLRESGWSPDPALVPTYPAAGPFNPTVILSDLNMAQGVFMSDVGWRPQLAEKVVTLPIVAGLDYTLPTDCYALTRVEYQTGLFSSVKIEARTFDEFDQITAAGYDLNDTGYPVCYRMPYGNPGSQQIRLWPAPSYGNAGTANGAVGLTGTPVIGSTASLTVTNGVTPVTVTTVATATSAVPDMLASLVALLNASGAVTGATAYLKPASVSYGQQIVLGALVAGTAANAFTFSASSSPELTITPTATTNFVGGGVPDNIVLYYNSLGTTMVLASDSPGIPVVFHEALACWVLSKYWRRKNDEEQVALWRSEYLQHVRNAKAMSENLNQSGQASIADEEGTDSQTPFYGTYF